MLGAIIGDIVGSIYEFDNIKTKEFPLFSDKCFFTDDSILTLSVAKAILNCNGKYDDLSNETVKQMVLLGTPYIGCGWGGRFYHWLYGTNKKPYNSFGNGSAMRVSSCAYAAKDLKELDLLVESVTNITHNHPEGVKGAKAIAYAIYFARQGKDKDYIRQYINEHFYNIDFTIDQIKDSYLFNETCQGSVPQAIECFLESNDFEDAIRLAISLGGDSDTIACMTGSIAEAYYKIPEDIKEKGLSYLTTQFKTIVNEFYRRFNN